MLEAKLQENKLLLKCIKESDALKSLLDTPHKHVLFCPTVSVIKDGKITEMPVFLCCHNFHSALCSETPSGSRDVSNSRSGGRRKCEAAVKQQ